MGGLRDRRTLARHLRGCQPCRREALAMGLGGAALESSSGLRGGLSRVAALLPLPWLVHRRADETDAASSAGGAGGGSLAVHAQTAVTQLSASMGIGADQAATAIHKAVAVVAAVAVVGGGGFVAAKGESRLGLLPAPAQKSSSAHADDPTRAPALLPLNPGRLTVAPTALTSTPASPAHETVTSPLLPTAPSGVPGPIDTLGVPDAVTAPKAPADPGPSEAPAEPEAQSSTPAAEPSLPAAGEVGTSTPAPEVILDTGTPPAGDVTDVVPPPEPAPPPDISAPAPDPVPCDLLPGLATSCPGLETATDPVPPAAG
jgi:hypothetical protein